MKLRGAILPGIVLAGTSLLAHADPVSLKNGKWEVTYRATEGGKQYARTIESCNRKIASEKTMLKVMSEKGVCTRRALSRTDTSIDVEIDCTAPTASKAEFKYAVNDGTQVNASTDEQGAKGGKRHIEAVARWVGSCAHAG